MSVVFLCCLLLNGISDPRVAQRILFADLSGSISDQNPDKCEVGLGFCGSEFL